MELQLPVSPNPTTTDSPNHVVPVGVSTEEEESRTFLELESLWEKEMKDFSPKTRYRKVECLLLYWRKENEGYLDVEPEVC